MDDLQLPTQNCQFFEETSWLFFDFFQNLKNTHLFYSELFLKTWNQGFIEVENLQKNSEPEVITKSKNHPTLSYIIGSNCANCGHLLLHLAINNWIKIIYM
jgi:hypothetical protein